MPRLRPLVPLLALLAFAAAPAAAHASDAPVAAYGFEETSTTTVDDNSGNGHTGTILGGATHVAGHSGNALSFDGVNDRVSIPDATAFAMTTGLTLEAWVDPATTAGWRTVVLKERPGDLSYALYGSGPDKPNGQVFSGGDYRQALAPSALTANQWSHVAMTWDGSVAKVYINGTQVGTASATGALTSGSGPLDIGGNGIWSEWFNGAIDDVRVYDRALSASEITSDMNTPVSGTSTPPPPPPPPPPGADQVGSWTPPQDWPMVAVHTSMLSNGKVVAWDAFSAAQDSEHVWDPETNQFVSTPSGINLFCAGHVLLPDGRLFTAGGHVLAYVGLQNTELFNPLTRSWTAGPDMTVGRWYPTTTTMPDGRVLIVSGDSIQQGGPYTPFYAPSDTLPEIYDPKTDTMTDVPSAARRMPLYPFMFVTPDGKVVDAGPDKTTRIFDPATGLWTTLASQSPIDGHSAVMYRPGKILKSGTWTDPDFPNSVAVSNRAAVLDMDQGVPSWREVSPMHYKRTFHTLTVLPDGKVLALGGQSKAGSMSVVSDPVLTPEIWDPVTDTWTAMAQNQIGRGYHNTSLLLPDGRILLAGSGRLDGSMMPNEANAEIYSPPYLFKGTRPTITYAPPSTTYGAKFTVATPDANSVTKVSLVRIGAVTHNFNMDQRWEELTFRKVGADLEVDAPASANDAPPGVYYVFLLNANGVPSKAAIVSISADGTTPPQDTQAPTVPANVTATGALGKVTLNWTASTDNVGVTKYSVYRSTTSGFTPGAGNLVATVTSGTSFADNGLAAGTYYYRVIAEDAAGNKSAASAEASGTATADTTAPSVSITAPAAGATVSGTVTVSANASDNVGVAGVQFKLDGNALGAEDTSAPYSVSWDTTGLSGSHTLTAVARDAAANSASATNVSVTVDNSPPAGPTPVAAYSFDAGSGTTLADTTGKGHTGTIREAAWTTTGKNGGALRFDGVNDWVTINDTADLRLSTGMTLEAWVNPTNNSGWRTAIFKERTGDLAYALYAGGSTTPLGTITTSATGYGEVGNVAGSAPVVNTWTHLATTYDGTTLKLYKNGTQIASTPFTGAIFAGTGALRLGGNNIWSEWFAGQLDDVRIYSQALTAAQIQTDMNTSAGTPPPPDTQAPTVPANVTATGALGKVTLNWTASTDNVGVTKYSVYRSTTSGFTPGAGNLIATVTSGTTYADNGLAAGTYFYRVIAEDAAGNKSAASAEASGTATADTTAPTVSITAPAAGATVGGTVTVSANASDDVGVAGVQFKLDGNNLGSEDTSAPYSVSWDTTGLSGSHTLTAVARDAASHSTTSGSVSVTVDNSPPAGPAPVAAYSFDAGSGTTLADTTGKGHTGTVFQAAWTTTGKHGGAMRFDGVNDWVTINDTADLRLSTGMTLEAWVNPTNNTGWRTAIFKERTNDLAYALYAGGSTTPLGTITTSAAGYGEVGNVAGSAPVVNTWTHLATTYDGTTLKLYKNGTQIASTPYSGAIFAGTGPLRLGGNNIWSEWFAGQLDDVRVYNQALNATQIQADMNAGA